MHALKPRDRIELNKKYVGFVFQQYHLLDDLTVAENLDSPCPTATSAHGAQGSVADTLDRFGSSPRRTSTRASSPAASNSWWAWPAR